jgi:hypothetical protein
MEDSLLAPFKKIEQVLAKSLAVRSPRGINVRSVDPPNLRRKIPEKQVMENEPNNPRSATENLIDQTENLSTQPLRQASFTSGDKSEHVPPIIIKGGSFMLEASLTFKPPSGVFNPPFTYLFNNGEPFPMRGIKIFASPFGAPETLFYNSDPDFCKIEIRLKRMGLASWNLSFQSLVSNDNQVLQLTTHDHSLPLVFSVDPATDRRPHKYTYANDNSIQIERVAVLDRAGQIIYLNPSPAPEYRIAIWMAHSY